MLARPKHPLAPSAPRGQRVKMPVKKALHRYGIGRTNLHELLGSGALKASKLGAKTRIEVMCADLSPEISSKNG
jgi:hypothetical protein